MPKCGKFGAASTAAWGAGAAIFSPVGRVVLLQKGGSPPQTPPHFLEGQFTTNPRCNRFTTPWSSYWVPALFVKKRGGSGFSQSAFFKWGKTVSTRMPAAFLAAYAQFWRPYTRLYPFGSIRLKLRGSKRIGEWVNRWIVALTRSKKRLSTFWFYFQKVNRWIGE